MSRTLRSPAARPAAWAAGALGALGAGALAVRAAWVEPRKLVVERAELRLPRWPAVLDGLKLGVIADLHVGAPHVDLRRLERVIDRVRDLNPDMVAILGDFLTEPMPFSQRIDPVAIAKRVADLRVPLGVFAVLGNSDDASMRRALERTAVELLENDVRERWWHGQRLWIAGFADVRTADPDVEGVLARTDDEDPVLALTHSPDLFPRMPPRVSLTLAGHTHAGQVNVPVVTRRVVPSWFGGRYRAGHIVEHDRHLFVHAGIGTSTLPVRFRAVPRVSVLTLRSQ